MRLQKQSRFTVAKPFQYKNHSYIILFHTVTKAICLLNENRWPPVEDPQAIDIDKQILKALIDSGILVENTTDEDKLFSHWKDRHVYDHTCLKFKTLVTRRCNNRCTYCVLDEEPKEMTGDTARAADRFIFSQIEKMKPVEVRDNFSGGEPLLNVDLILQSVEQRHAFCREKGIAYRFGFITNGTRLSSEVVQSLAPFGLQEIRVSLTGPQAIHNKLRPCIDHADPYSVIIDNLEAVAPLVPIHIECQYDVGSDNYLAIPQMLDDLKARGIEIKDIAFTHIMKTRRKSAFGSSTGDPEIHTFLMQQAFKRGFPVYDDPPSNHCLADFEAIYIIDTDGAILPCASLQSGEMAYGDVFSGIDFKAESQLVKRQLPSRCLKECELLPLCGGGCRLQALVHEGDFNAVDCHYDSMRELIEHWMAQRAIAELSGPPKDIDT